MKSKRFSAAAELYVSSPRVRSRRRRRCEFDDTDGDKQDEEVAGVRCRGLNGKFPRALCFGKRFSFTRESSAYEGGRRRKFSCFCFAVVEIKIDIRGQTARAGSGAGRQTDAEVYKRARRRLPLVNLFMRKNARVSNNGRRRRRRRR